MEVLGHENMKMLWEVVDDHVVEDPTDHEEIGLRVFDFNVFDKYEEGVVREGSSEFPSLLMLIMIRPGYWVTQLIEYESEVG